MQLLGVYTVTRHYGGPEEGGWWYNQLEHVESVEAASDIDPTRAALAAIDITREALAAKHADLQYGDIYSVLGGQQVQVLIESTPGEWQTTERPRYE